MKKQIETLTEQESAFAAENHSLIFRFLSRKGLPEDEYYDVVAFGYLNGVKSISGGRSCGSSIPLPRLRGTR